MSNITLANEQFIKKWKMFIRFSTPLNINILQIVGSKEREIHMKRACEFSAANFPGKENVYEIS